MHHCMRRCRRGRRLPTGTGAGIAKLCVTRPRNERAGIDRKASERNCEPGGRAGTNRECERRTKAWKGRTSEQKVSGWSTKGNTPVPGQARTVNLQIVVILPLGAHVNACSHPDYGTRLTQSDALALLRKPGMRPGLVRKWDHKETNRLRHRDVIFWLDYAPNTPSPPPAPSTLPALASSPS